MNIRYYLLLLLLFKVFIVFILFIFISRICLSIKNGCDNVFKSNKSSVELFEKNSDSLII
jgi:hypothetical protein